MADEKEQGGAKGLVDQVYAEMKKAKRESAKAKIKTLLVDLEKANTVRQGIIDAIAAEVASVEEEGLDLATLLK